MTEIARTCVYVYVRVYSQVSQSLLACVEGYMSPSCSQDPPSNFLTLFPYVQETGVVAEVEDVSGGGERYVSSSERDCNWISACYQRVLVNARSSFSDGCRQENIQLRMVILWAVLL